MFTITTHLHHVHHYHSSAPCPPLPLACTMFTITASLHHVHHYHSSAPCPPLPLGCTMSAIITHLHHVHHYHSPAPCPPLPLTCTMSTITASLHHVHHYHSSAPCPPLPLACTMFTITASLHHVHHYHSSAPCPPLPLACTMSAIITHLHHVHHYHSPAPCPPLPLTCTMSTITASLHHVRHYHSSAPCPPLSLACTMSAIITSLHHGAHNLSSVRVPYRCLLQYANPEELLVYRMLSCYVNPVISILGFSANMMSIAILRRSGLRKPSNILLFGLVLADSLNQVTTMNYAQILLQSGPNKRNPALCGWQYGRTLNFFLVISRLVFYFCGNLGQYVCTVLPVLITIERILAVFVPLTFRKIVTPKTAAFSVLFAFLFWSPWLFFYMSYNEIYYLRISDDGDDYAVYITISDRLLEIMDTFQLLNYYVFDSLESWVPIIFVTVGCVLISIKVHVSLKARRKLAASSAPTSLTAIRWSPRTTRTLLTTCCVFAVTHVVYSFINYQVTSAGMVQYWILVEWMNLLYLLNSSSNFFVYITSNKKLLQIILDIVSGR
ncbi:hypothetical protein Btru_070404 [Bulinus truncatus]|nr:hypothetical protein Btru_070404 [Bulinus truncatus]